MPSILQQIVGSTSSSAQNLDRSAAVAPSSASGLKALYERISTEFPSSYGKKNKALVESYREIMARLESMPDSATVRTPSDSPIMQSELWKPLSLSLDASLSLRVRELSLDALNRLLALGILTNEESSPTSTVPTMDNIASAEDITETKETSTPSIATLSSIEDSPLPDKNTEQDFLGQVMFTVVSSFSPLSQMVSSEEALHIQVVKVMLTLCTFSKMRGSGLLKAIQTCFNIYLYSKNKNIAAAARGSLSQIIAFLAPRYQDNPTQNNLNDLCLVLRALCKLSVKLFSDKPDCQYTSKCRLLALEQLHSLISLLAPFCKSQKPDPMIIEVLNVITPDFTLAVSKNATSQVSALFEASLSLFTTMVCKLCPVFLHHVHILLSDVYYPILTGNTSLQHKQLLLQTLTSFCKEPQLLIDIYINYDCEMGMPPCVEELIKFSVQAYSHSASHSLSLIETTLASLVSWVSRFEENYEIESPTQSPSTSSPLTSMTPESCVNEESVIQKKQLTKNGIDQFNVEPKKGVLFLETFNIVENSNPFSLAQFFHSNVHNINKHKLGDYLGDEKNITVMHAFIDAIPLKGIKFIEALRILLGKFKLPGEGQKIDRFMEKFADKFCTDNPDVFHSADVAYGLAFCVIMLNTDLHTKHLTSRMSEDEFVRNSRRIDEQNTLSDLFFVQVYEEIKNNEIIFVDDAVKHKPELESHQLCTLESEVIQKRSQRKILIDKPANAGTWKTAEIPDYARLLYQCCHTAMTTVLYFAKSFNGLKNSLIISTRFALRAETADLIAILAIQSNLWTLNRASSFLANTVSRVSSIISSSSPITTSPSSSPVTSEAIQTLLNVANTLQNIDAGWEIVLSCISELECSSTSQEVSILIDRIFTNTVNLQLNAMVDFVTALCRVSMAEAKQKNHFSIKKVVEMCYYNFNRIRYEFNIIFKIILNHFVEILHLHQQEDPSLCVFAVDSLRQLIFKFLGRDELANFNTQHEFMRYFYIMMEIESLQELILSSVQQIIQTRAKNIRSGWKVIFDVLSLARHSRTTESILLHVSQHLGELQNSSATVEYIDCLSKVCSALESTQLLQILLDLRINMTQTLNGIMQVILFQESSEMRKVAVRGFFDNVNIMMEGGENVFEQIMTLFAENTKADVIWIKCLQEFVRLWQLRKSTKVLAGVCKVVTMSGKKSETVAQCGVACFQDIVSNVSESTEWEILTNTLVQLIQSTIPNEIASVANSDDPKAHLELVSAKCSVHMSVLSLVHGIVNKKSAPQPFYDLLLPFLRKSRDMAHVFNSNEELRMGIYRANLTVHPPNLLNQEILAQTVVLLANFCRGDMKSIAELGESIVQEYFTAKDQSHQAPLVATLYTKLTEQVEALESERRTFFRLGLRVLRQDDIVVRPAVLDFMDRAEKFY